MPIEFRCTQCQTLLRTPDETAGQRAVCPKCGWQMDVPYVTVPTAPNPYAAPQEYEEPPPAPSSSPAEQMAVASLVLGIVSLCFSCCCLIGLPASIVGLVLGIKGLDSRQRGLAIAGIVLCALGLLASFGLTVANLLLDGGAFHGQRGFP